jgi:3-oxoacyl-[acyl-carrier-protein] synthase II
VSARRVAVTGIGWVTPLGRGREAVWQALLAGTDGLRPIESFDATRYPSRLGGEIPRGVVDLPVGADLPGRASQLAELAARDALADAGLDTGAIAPGRFGVAMGTTSGEPREVERFNDLLTAGHSSEIGGEFLRRYPCHSIATTLLGALGLRGPNAMIPTACAAGNYAVAFAFDQLRAGRADAMLAGGADAFSRITYTGFARLGAIAPDICRPFDKHRRGMVPGEGAAVLVLEPLDKALERGAPVYAEVAGYGLSCDAHHMTAAHPAGDGAARAMSAALASAGVAAADVSYVSAHGTGTPTNDKLETLAVRRVFGERAERLPLSSIKSMIGHTMGAASAIEAGVCALAIRDGRVPPTIHYETPDPECALDVVPNEARRLDVEVAMNNAYAFGGNNASVIFRRVSGPAGRSEITA